MHNIMQIQKISCLNSVRRSLLRGTPQMRQLHVLTKQSLPQCESPTTPHLRSTPQVAFPRRNLAISTEGTHIEHLIDKLSDSEYNAIANEYLETLSDDIEDLSEDFPQLDIELSQGVMTLTVAEGRTYVINKQPPNKQIWLSSPYSGPKRYDLIGGRWITLRDHSSLTDLLRGELEEELGLEITLTVEQ